MSHVRTCFFVIGLLSSTRMGAEILEEYGWIAARSPMGKTTGLCLPSDIGRFTKVRRVTRSLANIADRAMG